MERDNDADAAYEPRQLEGYYIDSFSKDIDRLNELVKLTPDEWAAKFEASKQESADYVVSTNEKRLEQKARYDAMIAKARQWVAPTKDHENFRDFMIKQLEESIDFDCREYTPWKSQAETVEEYRAAEIADARKSMESHSEQILKQADITISNNEWMYQLFRSLNA